MKIGVTGVHGRLSPTHRGSVERCVLLALSRYSSRVQRVTVRLTEPANPLGGIDQRCRMRAFIATGGDIRAEAIHGTVEAAVARAAGHLARRLALALKGGSG